MPDFLPHLTLSWIPGRRSARLSAWSETEPFSSSPGLKLLQGDFRPQTYVLEDSAHAVYIFGHPIIGERIDRELAAKAYLDAADVPAFARRLNGEFLLIHLDKQEQRLTIINDRFTAVPLYYALHQGRFLGSLLYNDLWRELKASGVQAVNQDAFFEFIYLQRLLGTKTYDNVSAFLPAASVLSCDGSRVALASYWRPSFAKVRSRSLEASADEFILRLKNSIRRKTSDNLRYGLFLSGGMDTRTILAASDAPPECYTVGFTENNEVRVARRACEIKQAGHRYLPIPEDYYARHFDALIALSGGMYVYDHALFLGYREAVSDVDVLFHGHGLDYFFQGMYMPAVKYEVFGHKTFLKRLRRPGPDVAADYLRNIHHRLKYVDLWRYIRADSRKRLKESLHASVSEIVSAGRKLGRTPYDSWEYILIHALGRHFSHGNVSSLMANAEERTISFDNDLFDFYLSLPHEHRFAGRMIRRALRKMNPQLADLEAANTGIRIDSSPWEQEWFHVRRFLQRLVTGDRRHRHPTAKDRTWPYRDTYLRAHPQHVAAIREMPRSPILAETLPFLDADAIAEDVEKWLVQPAGGGDFMGTLLTLDRFLKQSAYSDTPGNPDELLPLQRA